MSQQSDPLKADFRNFLHVAFTTSLNLPSPAVLQYDVAEFIQTAGPRALVMAQRGAGKSYITAVYAVWTLYCNPDAKVLCVSMNQNRAFEFVALCRQIIEHCPVCTHLRPRADQRDGAMRFDVGPAGPAKDPSIVAYGITSQIIGAHADLIIPDDIESQENTITAEARERLYQKVLDFENILNPGGQIVYLGTPHTEDSLYNKLKQNYAWRRWPAEFPDPQDEAALDGLAPWILETSLENHNKIGMPTYPERFPLEELLERKAQVGVSNYAMQYLLDTKLADADRYPLKCSDFIVHPVDPRIGPSNLVWGRGKAISDIPSVGFAGDIFYPPIFVDDNWQSWTKTVMFVDPSGKGKDETGWYVAKALNGMIHVPAGGGLAGGYDHDTVLVPLAEAARDYEVDLILCEPNYGGGMFANSLQPVVAKIAGQVLVEDSKWASGQKELRIIDILEPAMNQHRLVLDPSVARDVKLMQQVTRITRQRGCLEHDDRVEALAGAVGHFIDQVSQDTQKRALEYEAEKREQAMEEFMENWNNPRAGSVRVTQDSITVGPRRPQARERRGWGPRASRRAGRKGWH